MHWAFDMSAPNNKPATPASGASRKSASTPSHTTTPKQSSTPRAGAGSPSLVNRSRSVRTTGAGTPVSARAAVRKPMSSSTATNASNGSEADAADVKAQTAAAIEDLQERLQKAEEIAEQYQKQSSILQTRLDDARNDQTKLEENVHDLNERNDGLENEKRDMIRQKRELENIYETDRSAGVKEREQAHAREEELIDTIQRLKETIAQRELRAGVEDERRPSLSRNCRFHTIPSLWQS